MFRYVAFLWDPHDADQQAIALSFASRLSAHGSDTWRCVLCRPGVHVHCVGERSNVAEVHILPDTAGVVLGMLFERTSLDEHATLSSRAILDYESSRRIVDSGGRELVSRYWGNYAAIIHDAACDRTHVLRGPASSLPCLRGTLGRLEICFSSIEDWISLGFGDSSINWEFVRLHLIAPVPTNQTGLNAVTQLLPGDCLVINRGHASKASYWDPLDVSCAGVVENADEAATMLHAAVKNSVHTWAACHESILLYLSGGLDSSIVLASLRDAPKRPRVTCLTEYSPGADSDEREYARLMVRHVGFCKHIEQLRDSDISLEAMLDARVTPMPQGTHRRVEAARREAQLAHRCGASAIFSGSGGDQLFFQNSARLTVADFLLRHGVHTQLAKLIYEAAQLEKKSIWRISRDALANVLLPERFDPLTSILEEQTIVSAETGERVRAVRTAQHGQRRRGVRVPPGKLWHAYDVAPADCYYDPLGEAGDPEQIAPLLSQPLIETVLKIPTYLLLADGWERGLARRAFKAELPLAIARRRSKGGVEEHLFDTLQRNKIFARDLLIDGILAKRGLVDPDRLASALSDGPSGVLKGSAEIYVYLATEAWLRTWERRAQRAAA